MATYLEAAADINVTDNQQHQLSQNRIRCSVQGDCHHVVVSVTALDVTNVTAAGDTL